MEGKSSNEMRLRGVRRVDDDAVPRVARVKKVISPLLLVVFILVILLATTGYFAYSLYSEKMDRESVFLADDKKNIIENVGKHVVVNTAEDPILATVTDPKELAGQPFFTNAEIGDKVLVYPVAERAILYRPSIDRVVEMMPYGGGANTGL